MKQETNNEMDLLLRRLSRRSEPALSAAGNHLDADELSAYAENALPAAARARHTEHLADCSSCRTLVVQLSSAAGVVAASATPKVSEPVGWRRLLASFFSPMVLRYAAPALGLIVVAVIGVVVMKREQADPSVAQLTAEQAVPVQPENDQTKGFMDSPSPSPMAYDSYNSAESAKRAPVDEKKETNSPQERPQATPAKGDVAAFATEPPPVKREEQPAAKVAPAAPQSATVPGTESSQPKNAEVARKQEAEVTVRSDETTNKSFEAGKPTERKVEGMPMQSNSPRSRGITSVQSAGTAGAGSIQKDGVDSKEKSRDDDAETRSVAGRTFRKQGNVWIDTAYVSSKGTTNLSRGSEHYRSLVADEPAIKNIADQLGSEFIVVWKGRAYRIR